MWGAPCSCARAGISRTRCDDAPDRRNPQGKRYKAYGSPWQRVRAVVQPGFRPEVREFVALEGVSLSVPRGSALGVVGPNGAGKSTLLKILAGIVLPSEGEVQLDGTVASIIELGAGFHPDFTGRQNALLNAEILGFSAQQAEAAYADVAAFCELGRYLDMPVKTYSSGMFVRLAFAVAISARPDILLVDEALAVGDAVFAHRCLDRIRRMRDAGVTIVFVTHDMNMITGVCDRAIYLDRGRLVGDGPPAEIVHSYLLNVAERLTSSSADRGVQTTFHEVGAPETGPGGGPAEKRFGSFHARITRVAVEDAAGRARERFVAGDTARFRMAVRFDTAVQNPVFGLMLKNRFGVEVFGTNTHLRSQDPGGFTAGEAAEVVFTAPLHLGSGTYTASFAVHTAAGHFYDYRVDARVFEISAVQDAIGMVRLPTELEVRRLPGGEVPDDDLLERVLADAPAELVPDANSARFLAGSWHAAEDAADGSVHRWTGREAAAYLRIPKRGRRVVARLCSLSPEPVGVVLGVGGAETRVSLAGSAWTEVELAVPETAAGAVVPVRVAVDRVWVPSEADPASADHRALGVLVAWIRAE